MQSAIKVDQAVIRDENNIDYVDGTPSDVVVEPQDVEDKKEAMRKKKEEAESTEGIKVEGNVKEGVLLPPEEDLP